MRPDASWAFYAFDDTSCQLHPARANAPPSRISRTIRLDGPAEFASIVEVAHPRSGDIVFTIIIDDPTGGNVVVEQSCTVQALQRIAWTAPLPSLAGEFRVTMQTRMADPGRANDFAWARWHEPMIRSPVAVS